MSTTSEQAEIQALRARVERLEAENAELAARANAAVAAAQDRAYWLDRWHLDLNALMRRPRRRRSSAPRCAASAAVVRRAEDGQAAPRAMTPSVAVVVPVKDGARYLAELLAALAREGADEVLVIDSGLARRLAPRSRAAPASSCSRSPPAEFGHGRTRNLGAERTSGGRRGVPDPGRDAGRRAGSPRCWRRSRSTTTSARSSGRTSRARTRAR